MRKIFPILVPLLVCFIRVTVSAPLGVDIIDPYANRPVHDNDKKRLENARVEANKHIDNMHRVMKDPHRPEHQKIINAAFGSNANIRKIGENVEQLRGGKISIDNIHHPGLGRGVKADTSERWRTVRLGAEFHHPDRSDESRGGTLIHEAAHALFDAHDHFSKGPHSKGLTDAEAHHAGSNKLTGYTHSPDFETLRKDHSHLMHSNADSYKLFGQLAMKTRPLTNQELNAGRIGNPYGRPAGSSRYADPHPVTATHTRSSAGRLPLPRPPSPKRQSITIPPSRPAGKPQGSSLVRTKSSAGGSRHTAPGSVKVTQARPSGGKLPLPRPASPKHAIPPSRPVAKHSPTSGRPPVRPKSPSQQAAPGPGAGTRTRSSSGKLPPPRPATPKQRNNVKSPSRPATKHAPPPPPQVRPKSSAGGSRHPAPGPVRATQSRPSGGKPPLPHPASPKQKNGAPPSRAAAKSTLSRSPAPVRPKSPATGGNQKGKKK